MAALSTFLCPLTMHVRKEQHASAKGDAGDLCDRAHAASDGAACSDACEDCWLFQGKLPTAPVQGAAFGDAVLEAEPEARALRMISACPGLLDAMRAYPRDLVAAGGSVLGAVAKFCPSGNDIDLFLCLPLQPGGAEGGNGPPPASSPPTGVDSDVWDACVRRADHILADLQARLVAAWGERGDVRVVRSTTAVTLLMEPHDAAAGQGHIVQVILRVYTSPKHLLLSFDLPPSQVCAFFDTAHAELPHILATHSWVEALRHMAFCVDPHRVWSRASVPRLLKYHAKGFEIAILGTRRRAFSKTLQPMQIAGDHGIAALFAAERRMVRTRQLATDPGRFWRVASVVRSALKGDAWPTLKTRTLPAEVQLAARILWGRHSSCVDGYDDVIVKLAGVFTSLVRGLVRTAREVLTARSAERQMARLEKLFADMFAPGSWHLAPPASGSGTGVPSGAFRPANPRLQDLYDMQLLHALLQPRKSTMAAGAPSAPGI